MLHPGFISQCTDIHHLKGRFEPLFSACMLIIRRRRKDRFAFTQCGHCSCWLFNIHFVGSSDSESIYVQCLYQDSRGILSTSMHFCSLTFFAASSQVDLGYGGFSFQLLVSGLEISFGVAGSESVNRTFDTISSRSISMPFVTGFKFNVYPISVLCLTGCRTLLISKSWQWVIPCEICIYDTHRPTWVEGGLPAIGPIISEFRSHTINLERFIFCSYCNPRPRKYDDSDGWPALISAKDFVACVISRP